MEKVENNFGDSQLKDTPWRHYFLEASLEYGEEKRGDPTREETRLLPSGVCFFLTLFARLGHFLKYT